MKNEQAIRTLNALITVSRDGALGFDACALRARDFQLRRIFQDRARECADAARELALLVRQLGGVPESQHINEGSAGGAARRGWFGLHAALARDDDCAVLEECERGEDYALERYRNAIDDELPELARRVVVRQFEGTMSNHDQIRALRLEFQQPAGQSGQRASAAPKAPRSTMPPHY